MQTIKEICKNRLIIPINQRGFSWNISNIEDIFSDLTLAGMHSHYMGPIIVSKIDDSDIKEDNFSHSFQFNLEDGQQRITTLFIILNEFRKQFKTIYMNNNNNSDAKQSYDELTQTLYFTVNGELNLRLKNENLILDNYYSYIFDGTPKPASHTPPMRKMDDAKTFINEKTNDWDLQKLILWKNKLLNQAKLIWVDLATEGINRYLAFDAINSRGLPLSEFDKIKNFSILVNETKSLNMIPDNAWYKAIENLEKFSVSSRSNEETYITDLFSAYHNSATQSKEVHTRFVKAYGELLNVSNSSKETNLKNFVSLWESYANSFGFITSKQRDPSLCTMNAYELLKKIDNMNYSGVTRVLLTVSHLMMDKNAFEKVVYACEIYTFRVYAVMRSRKDKNSIALLSLANKVLSNKADEKMVTSQICSWLDGSESIDGFATLTNVIDVLATGDKYNGWPSIYYFLYEYELYCSPAGVTARPWARSIEEKINTMEHILPQKSRDGSFWEAEWPDEADAIRYAHRLGNLVLTDGNLDLLRKPFNEKLNDQNSDYYFNSVKATNSEKQIYKFSDGFRWQKKNILLREAFLFEFVLKRWSIPCLNDKNTYILPEEFIDEDGSPIMISIENN